MELSGQCAVVTGASRNIGLSIATRLAHEGARVALVDIRQEVHKRAAELQAEGYPTAGFVSDITNRLSVAQTVDAVLEEFGRIDVLVNNAAIFSSTCILDLTDEEIDRVWAVNLKGVLHCAQTVVPHMMSAGGGRVINIGSLAGKRGRTIYGSPGSATEAAYTVSKAAVMTLTKAMAWEWAPHNIYVNAVSPGNIYVGQYDDETKERLETVIPVGHVGKPEDIAHAVAFLASPEATYLTGETLDVDGGVLMD